MFLGDLIKKYRKDNELSQRDFAKICGLSHTYIAALEKNLDSRTNKPIAPTLDTVKHISNAMNIDIKNMLNLLDDNQEFTIDSSKSKGGYTTPYATHISGEVSNLPEEAQKDIDDFIEFLKIKYKDKIEGN